MRGLEAQPDVNEVLRPADAAEPLGLWFTPQPAPAEWPDLCCDWLEFSSRGDRVGARLFRPSQAEGPLPAILLACGLGDSASSSATERIAAPWAKRGAAVLAVDLPLHGSRADAKLRDWLQLRPDPQPDPLREALAIEFARQAVIDLQRALDALQINAAVDAERVAFAGFRLGARIGAAFCALDPRPRAAALALAGSGGVPAVIDPAHFVAQIAPRPLLFVGATADAWVSRESAEALFAAAPEPREQLWFEASHEALPDEALEAIWSFLARELET